MRILIVDDEAPARERLRRMLGELGGQYRIAGEAADGTDVVPACQRLQIDLVLLDVSMPGLDGLTLAHRLAELEPPPAVILVTAYPEHALEAFERRVMDYLVKPVRSERLLAALEGVRVPTRPQRHALLPKAAERTQRSRLSARYRGGFQTVHIDEVIYLMAENKYVVLRHGDGNMLLDESLKALEEEFPERFVRIHRNALVARQRIAGLVKDKDGMHLVRLRGCEERLAVSRRHLPELKRWLQAGLGA